MQIRSSLPADYAIIPLAYPDDTEDYLNTMEDAFSNDPTSVYVHTSTKNPTTFALRRHMRVARFKNIVEGLAPEQAGTDSFIMKLVHIPTGAIVGGSGWQVPGRAAAEPESTQTTDTSRAIAENGDTKPPYSLLPPGSEIAAEDSGLSSLGPAMNIALEELAARIPALGPPETRNKNWWYLASLGISTAHQGHRLGQAMVQWGFERAMQDAADRPELAIKGVWLVATEAGRKTYEHAGFIPVAAARVVYGDGKGGVGIQVFHDEAVSKVAGKGQTYIAFVKEFDKME